MQASEEREAVLGVFRDSDLVSVPSEFQLERLLGLLRAGKGEEDVAAWLSTEFSVDDADLLHLSRAILRIGVRPRQRGWRRKRLGSEICTICEVEVPYCFSCKCGLRLCQKCMDENRWGITCNNVTWECPDCGGMRSY